MKFPSLSAEWRKIMFINYVVPEEILQAYLPPGTELDLYNGECLVSLVGFQFLNLAVLNVTVPFHQKFEEFNLRFYVVCKENGKWKRGVVFISEIVPKRLFKLLANTFVREKYVYFPMGHHMSENGHELKVDYSFKIGGNWNSIKAVSGSIPSTIKPNTLDDFIAEHYFGYNKWDTLRTVEYKLDHPTWSVYNLKSYEVDIRFEDVYPKEFYPFLYAKPHSAQLVEGSEIRLFPKRFLV